MSRLGDFIARLRFGPSTQTIMRDSQGNAMDIAELEEDETDDLREMDAEQKQRARWALFGRWLRPRGGWWWFR